MRHLVAWKPMQNLFATHNAMSRVFDEFFGHPVHRDGDWDRDWLPVVDIAEVEDHVEIRAEIPGVSKEDVHVSVTEDVLTLKGEKKQEKTEDGKNYHRVERSYGTFQRSFTLPKNLQADKVKAAFKDGVLTVSIPKVEKVKPKNVEISTE